jgi:hypothetical protein
MGWRIYFWAYASITVLDIIFTYGKLPLWGVSDILDIAVSIGSTVGLYAFVYRQKYFSKQTAQLLFWAVVAWTGLQVLYTFTKFSLLANFLQSNTINGQDFLIAIFLSLPMYYALYLLSQITPATKKPSKKKKR